MATDQQIAVMAKHYCVAAVWADCPEGTNPRVTREALRYAEQTCRRFVELIGPLFDEALQCKGYGSHPDCGFWDRDALGPLGDQLSEFCGWRKPIGEPEPYFCRGWLYFMGSTA